VKIDNYEDIKASLDEFLRKENSSLDKYDFITKKVWLTIGKPEPQAKEFGKTLKNLIDSFTKSSSWKVLYKIKKQDPM
jgi:hypothetical protein